MASSTRHIVMRTHVRIPMCPMKLATGHKLFSHLNNTIFLLILRKGIFHLGFGHLFKGGSIELLFTFHHLNNVFFFFLSIGMFFHMDFCHSFWSNVRDI